MKELYAQYRFFEDYEDSEEIWFSDKKKNIEHAHHWLCFF